MREFSKVFKNCFSLGQFPAPHKRSAVWGFLMQSSLLVMLSFFFFPKVKEILDISSQTPNKCWETFNNEQLLVSQDSQAIWKCFLY